MHWHDRSAQLVTVSGTRKHTPHSRGPGVCVSLRNQDIRKHHEENTRSHTVIDPLPPGGHVSAGPPSSVTVNIITA